MKRLNLLYRFITITRQGLVLVLALVPLLGFAAVYSNADLNGDAIVTSQDISKLASCFGQSPTSNSICYSADVDRDNDIDVNDFGFVSARMGQAYPWTLYPFPIFSTGISVDTRYGGQSSSVLGDVNGDDTIDLVLIHDRNSICQVMLGNGDGGFQQAGQFAVGDGPVSAALGDLNGDNKLDLVIVNYNDNDVSLLLGNGDGNFKAQQRIPVEPRSRSVSLADINGDGVLDMVIANSNISVFLGIGDGTFQDQPVQTGHGGSYIALGDVNADGSLDAVVTYLSGIGVHIGNGDGSFKDPQIYYPNDEVTFALSSAFVNLGDINGDGSLDVVIGDDRYGTITMFYGDGAGGFGTQSSFFPGNIASSITLGDVNADGALDIVVMRKYSERSGGVMLNNGSGLFLDRREFSLADSWEGWFYASLGDLNGDSVLDIVVSGSNGDVSVLLGNDASRFPESRAFVAGMPENRDHFALGDVNRDGSLDVVTTDISVMLGSGDGVFEQRQHIADHINARIFLSDLDGDDMLDIMAVRSDDVVVMIGNGDGSFRGKQIYDGIGDTSSDLGEAELGDLNGDGISDLVICKRLTNYLSILIGDGYGGFLEPQRLAVGDRPFSTALGDVNGDSVLDVVTAVNSSNDVLVMTGEGDGGFKEQQRIHIGENISLTKSVLSDINGDGFLDILAVTSLGDVLIFGDGDGSFDKQQSLDVYPTVNTIVGDINGDETPDIVVSNDKSLSLLLGNGDGSFTVNQKFGTNGTFDLPVLGDVNGDGAQDILLHLPPNGISVLINKRHDK